MPKAKRGAESTTPAKKAKNAAPRGQPSDFGEKEEISAQVCRSAGLL